MHIELDDLSRPAVHDLLREHLQNMIDITPAGSVHALDLEKLRNPNITFWTAWDEGVLLGCGALTAQGEIKSMRTPSLHRRKGAGRAILMRIIETARGRGYERLNLETGSQAAFEPAHRLYESVGFVRTGPFGDYVCGANSVFMTLPLKRNVWTVKPLQRMDYAQWRPLWDGYNAFYGRSGSTALPESITAATWERFFDANEPVHAFAAWDEDRMIGIVHYLYHRSTTRLHDVCYLQDLFTAASQRGRGVGRQLIEAVNQVAKVAGCSRVYWTTHTSNEAGRKLYDKVAKHLGFIVYGQELA